MKKVFKNLEEGEHIYNKITITNEYQIGFIDGENKARKELIEDELKLNKYELK